MGLRVAVANGNWSNTATWNGGVLPAVGDVVASNNFTVTIDQNINVDTLTNAAQALVGAVPNMTSATTPSGIVTASQGETGNFAAWKAFESDINTEWTPSGAAWIAYEFPTPKAINQYTVGTYGGLTGSWTFEGWNGSTWIVLHTVVSTSFNYTSPLIGNSTLYIKYRLNYSPSAPPRVFAIQFYEYLSTSPAVAGGGFILNSGVTVTCTNSINGFVSGSNSLGGLIVFSLTTGQSATLIGNTQVTILSNARVVYFNGIGTLNWIGNWEGVGSGQNSEAVFVNTGTNGGIVNFTGNMTLNSSVIRPIVSINKIFTFNMTGNIDYLQSSGNSIAASPFSINTSFNFYLVGAIYGSRSAVISTTQTIYFNQVGLIMARINNVNVSSVVLSSTSNSSIHLMSGPFISDIYGALPFYVSRMNYIKTLGSYFEFRNSSTNGALPPAAPAPAIRMSSPEVVSDLPAVSNVRFGVVYGVGSFTGTMRVPAASNVRLGVDVDNTVGTGAVTAADVWNVLTSGLNTSGSIGERLKNTSTVDSTGDQLAALI
jgi:hypothetical protein